MNIRLRVSEHYLFEDDNLYSLSNLRISPTFEDNLTSIMICSEHALNIQRKLGMLKYSVNIRLTFKVISLLWYFNFNFPIFVEYSINILCDSCKLIVNSLYTFIGYSFKIIFESERIFTRYT